MADTPERRSEHVGPTGEAAAIETLVRVAIVSPVCLYRDGLVALLGKDEGIEVVGTAHDADAGVELAEHEPALILFDAMTAASDDGIRLLRERAPTVSILALTVPNREQAMLELAEAGVSGFVTVDDSFEELVAAIRSTARGEAICSPALAATLLRRLASLAHAQEPGRLDESLTVREREIVELIQEGLSNKQIAFRLRIQLSTVKNHVHSILGKLGVERRTEIVALGRERLAVDRKI
jgi:DNA-binding NarL/FixJ family response regulator